MNYTYGIRNGALIDVPEEGIHITNWDIRNTLNHTATYWNTSDWSFYDWIFKWPCRNAIDPYTGEPVSLWLKILLRIVTANIPVNPVAPWLQMSWGFVNESIVNDTIDVLLGKKEMPEKPEGAIRYMEAIYKIREMIWRSYS
ncbi:MAG: hypothetical protein U9O96_06710 [Candidatus Thermoplasmatota archaeon]|nr:hypothetical protein [Candidatus Thermoplasmatota archaeon]